MADRDIVVMGASAGGIPWLIWRPNISAPGEDMQRQAQAIRNLPQEREQPPLTGTEG